MSPAEVKYFTFHEEGGVCHSKEPNKRDNGVGLAVRVVLIGLETMKWRMAMCDSGYTTYPRKAKISSPCVYRTIQK
jgi:hypothetical protein